jgi:hypothetical protein
LQLSDGIVEVTMGHKRAASVLMFRRIPTSQSGHQLRAYDLASSWIL